MPATQEQLFQQDYFGLSLIYYAIAANTITALWYEQYKDNLIQTITSGYYQGINIVWALLMHKRYDYITRLTQSLSNELRYELLKSAPLNSNYVNYGNTVAGLLLMCKRYEDFTRLTQDLSNEQRYELLKSASLNPGNNNHGVTVAWLLLSKERYDDFTRLTQGLSVEQCLVLLNSNPPKPGSKTLISLLLQEQRYQDIERLTKGFTLTQLMVLLSTPVINSSTSNPNSQNKIYSIKRVTKNRCFISKTATERYEYNELLELYDKTETDDAIYVPLCSVVAENICLQLYLIH